jgi:hypothetical protein
LYTIVLSESASLGDETRKQQDRLVNQTLGTLVVLLVPMAAAMAAWFGHVVVRGTKISELRQKWIDDQRSDLAMVVSRAHLLTESTGAGSDLNELRAQALGELEAEAFRIKLRENPIKPEWTDVIERVERIREYVRDSSSSNSRLSSLAGGMIPLARCRLKREWNLVRDGETTYRRASRRFWVVVSLFAVLAIAIMAADAFVMA